MRNEVRYFVILMLAVSPFVIQGQSDDWRLITNGREVYTNGYCDQPYIVTTSDGSWICTFTTSPSHEGSNVQYIVSTNSTDQGKTWSTPVEIESSTSGLEASWAMPLVTEFDRIYAFYTFNGDSIRQMPDGSPIRSDTHGWYCYRYSDDKGLTWSDRHRLAMRTTKCDRENDFSGDVQMFWGVGKPVSKDNDVWFSFTKLGKYFLEEGEGWIYHSDNILNERDVSKLNWRLLPDGDVGIRSPLMGSVQEEFNIQPMNIQNGLYCVFRTTLGQPACSYSYDNGRTWTEPELITYANGMPLRNPRACPRLWKCNNGKYLLWHHNHGGRGFEQRNPAWLSGGIEKNGKIYWSQPEILIHGPDRSYETGRFSYPDLIEGNGKYWVSTTQKTAATIHEVPAEFLELLWSQFDGRATSSLRPTQEHEVFSMEQDTVLPEPIRLDNGGFALDFWIKFDALTDAVIFEGSDGNLGKMVVRARSNGTLEFSLANGEEIMRVASDRDRLTIGKSHHVAILVDADAKLSYMLIDGSICDGGGKEGLGLCWFDDPLSKEGIKKLTCKKFAGIIEKLRLYGERMSTSHFVIDHAGQE